MGIFVFRQEDVELSGQIVVALPSTDLARPNDWTLTLSLDPGQDAFLTNRNGVVNPSPQINASVTVPASLPAQPDTFAVLRAMLGLTGQRVRIVGTWVDNDVTGQTEIHPLLAVVVEHPLSLYDIDTWAVAIRDLDVLVFAHDPPLALGQLPELHAGESRTAHLVLPAPKRPTSMAIPFFRVYKDDRLELVQSASFAAPRILPNGDFVVDAEIVTGPTGLGQGFYFAHVCLTYEEKYLADLCPLGHCEDGKHCQALEEHRYSWVPPRVPEAKAGYLALSPGDGVGLVSGIVAALSPNQVYDHMGIFVDNGWTIRHCTSSQDRFQDEDLWTGFITVSLFFGAIEETQKVPLNGLRPDHVRFGWPGSITQSVNEVFYTGRNTQNGRWLWGTIHGTDVNDPEPAHPAAPPDPFRIYHLSPAERAKRVAFIDPEPSKRTDLIVRLQDTPVSLMRGDPPVPTPFFPTLVRPHSALAAKADPILVLVANEARHLSAHYRFFGYTDSAIATNPAFVVPAAGDPSWAALPSGAAWAAGTIPAMCSSFVWAAVQQANAGPPSLVPAIQLEDHFDPEDSALGREYGAHDGTYRYSEAERIKAANALFGKLKNKIQGIINDAHSSDGDQSFQAMVITVSTGS